MPNYEFECRECNQAFEVKTTVSEYTAMRRERQIVCPSCGSEKVIRMFSAPNIGAASAAPTPGSACCCPGGRCR